jgi:hypothetical protein
VTHSMNTFSIPNKHIPFLKKTCFIVHLHDSIPTQNQETPTNCYFFEHGNKDAIYIIGTVFHHWKLRSIQR